jgi:hypothetical protein
VTLSLDDPSSGVGSNKDPGGVGVTGTINVGGGGTGDGDGAK